MGGSGSRGSAPQKDKDKATKKTKKHKGDDYDPVSVEDSDEAPDDIQESDSEGSTSESDHERDIESQTKVSRTKSQSKLKNKAKSKSKAAPKKQKKRAETTTHSKSKSHKSKEVQRLASDAHRVEEQRAFLHQAVLIARRHDFLADEEDDDKNLDGNIWSLKDKTSHKITTEMEGQRLVVHSPILYDHLQKMWALNAAWHKVSFLRTGAGAKDGEFRISDDQHIRARLLSDPGLKTLNEHYILEYTKHMMKNPNSVMEKIVGCVSITGPGVMRVPSTTHFLLTKNYQLQQASAIDGFPGQKAAPSVPKGRLTREEEKALSADLTWLQRMKYVDYIVYVDSTVMDEGKEGAGPEKGKPRIFIRTDFSVFGLSKELRKTAREWILQNIQRKVVETDSKNLSPTGYADQIRERLGLNR